MAGEWIDQQLHGYKSGHQLLSASLKLPRGDQDTLDRLSDASGSLPPGEIFAPYVTAYPLPSRTHYVLARTWPDTSAPRAGCVLTRSLLIPMNLWGVSSCPVSALKLLMPIGPAESASKQLLEMNQLPLPPVSDHRVTELVEAIFFEPRQAIAMFDAPEADAIALRLLTAFWSGLRQSFSLCTLAMSPRRVEGKDFDLLFVPKVARTRFLDWRGRRIDISNATTPRHRWSDATTEQIFRQPIPTLGSVDTLGVLDGYASGDESALRLSLLWNELSTKASTNPTAVLGMLDIVSSRKTVNPNLSHRLLPLVGRSVEMAKRSLDSDNVLLFLSALIEKIDSAQLMSRSLVRQLARTASEVAKDDPAVALKFLEHRFSESELSNLLVAGVGDGLAWAKSGSSLGLLKTNSSLLSRTIYRSSRFAQKLASVAKEDGSWGTALVQAWLISGAHEQRRIRNRFFRHLDGESLGLLLPYLLAGLRPEELASYAVEFGKSAGFLSEESNGHIIQAAEAVGGLLELRNAIRKGFPYKYSEPILAASLRLVPKDIDWLMAAEPKLACLLLSRLLSRHSDSDLVNFLREKRMAEAVLSLLLGVPELGARQLLRCILTARLPIGSLASVSCKLAPVLSQAERAILAKNVLPRLMSEDAASTQEVSSAISLLAPSLDTRTLIQLTTLAAASSKRAGENLVLVARLPDVRPGLLSEIEFLSERIVQGRRDLGEAAFISWADLIDCAGDQNREAQLSAATRSLTYALAMAFAQVSSVVVVSFPLVISSIRSAKKVKRRESSYLDFIFGEWDEERSLYVNVVDAFLRSKWPPANLLLAAGSQSVADKLVEEVAKRHGGDRYLRRIEEDARTRLAPDRRTFVLQCLERARRTAKR